MTSPPVVALEGELDLSTVDEWEARVAQAARSTAILVLDLTRLEFVDSAAVDSLFRMVATLGAQGKRLLVVAPPGGPVRRLLDLLSFDAVAGLYDSLEDALAESDESDTAGRQ